MKKKIFGMTLTAIIVASTVFSNFGIESGATDAVKAEDILETSYAGAAQDLEIGTIPTDEDIENYIVENAWKNPGALVMAKVTDSVNVRAEASTESDRVGLLYSDCCGYIIEYTDTWTKISSGNVIGWVRNDFLYFGDEAEQLASEVAVYRATINEDTVRVRKENNTECDTYGLVGKGEVYEVIEILDGWVSIDYEGATGYVCSDYVDIDYHLDYGETNQEIEDREAAERAAQREAERIQYYGVYAASATDVELLGAIIQCEAGNQSYEGQVAVGAVVMNRVRSTAYPDTIYGVIYAAGQFTPAGAGLVDKCLENGVNAQCIQAAEEALSGYSNVGSATHFRVANGHEGIVIGAHVFW